jgi:hypothetical protein
MRVPIRASDRIRPRISPPSTIKYSAGKLLSARPASTPVDERRGLAGAQSLADADMAQPHVIPRGYEGPARGRAHAAPQDASRTRGRSAGRSKPPVLTSRPRTSWRPPRSPCPRPCSSILRRHSSGYGAWLLGIVNSFSEARSIHETGATPVVTGGPPSPNSSSRTGGPSNVRLLTRGWGRCPCSHSPPLAATE